MERSCKRFFEIDLYVFVTRYIESKYLHLANMMITLEM
jgi:hypothetical protein